MPRGGAGAIEDDDGFPKLCKLLSSATDSVQTNFRSEKDKQRAGGRP